MNSVVLIGSLDRDPELALHKGTAIVRFVVKTVHSYEDRGGIPREQVDLHRVIAYGGVAIAVSKLERGEHLGVEGRISSKSITRNGERRWKTEIVAERIEYLTPRAQKGKAAPAIVNAQRA